MSEHKQIAVVTGAGRGIGKAIAELLGANGYDVVVTARSISQITAVTKEILAKGGAATAIGCDITSSSSVAEFASEIHNIVGKVSILINNAGIAPSAKLEDTSDEIWQSTITTNLSGAFFMARAFAPDMKSLGGGHILSIASTAALQGFNYNSAYSASKHGLLGLTRALAVEMEKYKIAVNALCPGFVRTEILSESIANVAARTRKSIEEVEESFAKLNDEKRLLEPIEVARESLRILQQSEFITGKAFLMDGTLQ
jgi:NAD(P)-dependent dehydrogenase (short-subunit alcohol dehydrogenase family)